MILHSGHSELLNSLGAYMSLLQHIREDLGNLPSLAADYAAEYNLDPDQVEEEFSAVPEVLSEAADALAGLRRFLFEAEQEDETDEGDEFEDEGDEFEDETEDED